MNSEELEQSLRSEFETYLNSILADLRMESADFQNRIQAEFDRHRNEFDEAFAAISARFDTAPGFNEAFNSSVAEHLKLARDEGAKLAANAMVEAEKFDDQRPSEAAPPRYDAIRDAVNDISTKDSQSAILKSLVQQASQFAPRGAFFIIKSGHLAGWKVFGTDEEMENKVREVHFPVSEETILGRAIDSLSTVDGTGGQYRQDPSFTEPLNFGIPTRMMAFPLVARGRGVAVLCVDSGDTDGEINREALETVIRVAGLTVELLASTQTAAEENRTMAAADFENARHDQEEVGYRDNYAETHAEPASEAPSAGSHGGFSFTESVPESFEQQTEPVTYPVPEYGSSFEDAQPDSSTTETHFESTIPNIVVERPSFAQDLETSSGTSDLQSSSFETERSEPVEPAREYGFGTPEPVQDQVPSSTSDYSFPQTGEFATPDQDFGQPSTQETESPGTGYPVHDPGFQAPAPEYGQPMEARSPSPFEAQEPAETPPPASSFGSSPFDRAVDDFQPAAAASGAAYTPAPEPVVPAPAASVPQARLSDRPVDLPIEVPESERRLHNDARRFARLLVSEIKLYNEKKVIEGKQANDLYERLREAIDRSREMYDKRVQPPVASKFDYFHYELLNSLADGNVERLGAGYPGARV